HASADTVRVVFRVDAGMATLRVTDDGVGFDQAADPPGESYGLASMAWRAELVGGELTVRSRPGSGTTVTARVPVSRGR
ncbi:MAG TPA: ATP-binding protein, partial [Pseudonocardiaceae bacterium]|nr:ATP-binding protein [Pseudonocardiaceae bacterium]